MINSGLFLFLFVFSLSLFSLSLSLPPAQQQTFFSEFPGRPRLCGSSLASVQEPEASCNWDTVGVEVAALCWRVGVEVTGVFCVGAGLSAAFRAVVGVIGADGSRVAHQTSEMAQRY